MFSVQHAGEVCSQPGGSTAANSMGQPYQFSAVLLWHVPTFTEPKDVHKIFYEACRKFLIQIIAHT